MSLDIGVRKNLRSSFLFVVFAIMLGGPHFSISLAGEIESTLMHEASVEDTVDVIIYHKNQPMHRVSKRIKDRRTPELHSLAKRIKETLRPYLPRKSIRSKKAEVRSIKRAMQSLPLDVKSEIKAIRQQIDAQIDRMKHEVHTELRAAVEGDQQMLRYEIERLGGRVNHYITILNAVAATIPSESLEEIAELPGVLMVGQDKPGYPEINTSVPTISADTWWTNGLDGGIHDFGIVDSGVDSTHPALSSHQFFQRFAGDPTGHGTHVAGIVASTDAAFTGVAFGLDAIIVGEAGTESTSMSSVDWIFTVPSEQPEVINYSWGHGAATSDDSPIDRFFDAVVDGQATMVTKSVGNDGCISLTSSLTYPANAYNLIAVGNMNDNNTADRSDDFIASDSGRGPTVGGRKKPDLVAPGSGTDPGCPVTADSTDIFSTSNRRAGTRPDFVSRSGTSMAAAHMAGAVLLLEDGGNNNPMAQKAVLINTADAWSDNGTPADPGDDGPVAGKNWDPSYGWGYLNLEQAYVHRNDYFTGDVSPAGSANSLKLYKGDMFAGNKATLVWHRRIGFNGGSFPSTWNRLSDLDLNLYSEATNTLLDAANSTIDNVEQVSAGVSGSVVLMVEAMDVAFDDTDVEPFALATQELFAEAVGPAFSISLSHPSAINTGDQFTIAATVENSGDLRAHANDIELVLPAGFAIVSGDNPQFLGTIDTGASAAASWSVRGPASAGAYTFSATHQSASYDLIFTGSSSSTISVNSAPAPGIISVTPGGGLSSTGKRGGPFSPASAIYTLTNTGGSALNWRASKSQPWVSLSSTGGSLAAGADTTVTVSINGSAAALEAGAYTDTVSFANSAGGLGAISRPVSLRVTAQAGVLSITPERGLSSSGLQGGPFSPASAIYTLTNTGGSALNWRASKSQPWVSLSSTGGSLAAGADTTVTVSINGSAATLSAGAYTDTVSFANATDGLGDTIRSLGLTVTVPPGVLSIVLSDGLDSSGQQGGPFNPASTTYTLTNTGGSALNWTASKSQPWVSLSSSGGSLAAGADTTVTVSISAKADTLAAGSYADSVSFTNTTDGLGNTTRSVSLTVNANQIPIADAGPTQTVDEGETVTLDASNSSDPAGDPLTYLWQQKMDVSAEAPVVNLSDETSAQPTFEAPEVGPDGVSLSFVLTVTDSGGLSNSDTSIVNVASLNMPPTANAGDNQSVPEGQTVILDGFASFDPDGDPLTYLWEKINGPAVELSDETAAQPTFPAPAVGPDGVSLSFRLTVTDSGGLRDTDTGIVNVTSVNIPPMANAGNGQTVFEGESVILDGSLSSDPDGDVLIYLWTQTAGLPVTLSDTRAVQPTFVTPPMDGVDSILSFRLTVQDNGGIKDSDEVSVTVKDNGISGFPDDAVTLTTSTGEVIGIKIKEDSPGNIVYLNSLDPSTLTGDAVESENFIYGLFDVRIKVNLPGETVSATFYLTNPAPDQYRWYKFSTVNGWIDYSANTVFNPARDQVTITWVDGGAGDEDGVANGVIVDPSGLGQTAAAGSPDDGNFSSGGSNGGGGGGGCFISTVHNGQWLVLPGLGLLRD